MFKTGQEGVDQECLWAGVAMSDMNRDTTDIFRSEGETARWARIEQGVRQDAARLARLVLEGQAQGYEAQLLARRIDSVRTEGIGAEY
jgi:hypothetical protein